MIKLMKHTFYNEEKTKEKLCEFIKSSKILSMNVKCKEFEEKFSKYQGRKYSVMFNSGSSANLALIQSLINLNLLKKNDCVGFSALTWATNVMPLVQLGLSPIPLDVSKETLNVSSKILLKLIKKQRISALFLTNLLGFCGDLENIIKLCEENNILLLEDNCESLGSEVNNIKLGNFGLASTFSFFVGHHLSTIEGGMVCTDDKYLYDMLLMVRAHGWDRNLNSISQIKLRSKNKIDSFYSNYTFYELGYNLRPMEITGFLGLEQLNFIEEIIEKRIKNFEKYHEVVTKNKDIFTLKLNHLNLISNFAYPLIFKNQELFEKYKQKFIARGVEIRPIVGGSILEQPFFKKFLNVKENYSNSKFIHENGFYIPNNPDLTNQEINIILDILN